MSLAPLKAVATLGSRGLLDGRWICGWATPEGKVETLEYFPFDTRSQGMGAGPNLLQKTWGLLDAEVDLIKDPGGQEFVEYHKAKARGIAEVLALFMPPHFTTGDEIVREALRRYNARTSGDNEYETAGLGSRRLEPPPGATRQTSQKQAPQKEVRTVPAGSRTRAVKEIPSSAVDTSRKGIEQGMFTVAMIAKMYGTTEEQVVSQLDLP